jgi:hypothetical protein
LEASSRFGAFSALETSFTSDLHSNMLCDFIVH